MRRCIKAPSLSFTIGEHELGRTLDVILFSRSLCRPERLFAKPLDSVAAEKDERKGPRTAHSLPAYKTAHKLNHGVRWKSANVVANVAGGKEYRLTETHGEGSFDETGMYRDWLYGDERRLVNYGGFALFAMVGFLYYYTVKVMSAETWEIPAPIIASAILDTKDSGATNSGTSPQRDALANLKRPQTVTKLQST